MKTTQRSRQFKVGLATVATGMLLAVTGLAVSPASAAVGAHQIEICHGTSSATNPFTTPQPNKWQIVAPNGHDSHNGDANSYPDIIPPFAAGSKGNHSWDAYPGKNWNTEVDDTGVTGEEIWNAGCNIVEPVWGSITLDKVTAGDGQPAGTTAFTFTVSCSTEEGTFSAAPSITPEDPALVIASGLAYGEECTITETGAAGAASTSAAVDDGADVAGASTTVAMGEGQTVAVVFTNTYRCAQGQLLDGEGGCATDVCPAQGLQTNAAVDCPPVVIGSTVTPPVQVEGVTIAPAAPVVAAAAPTLPRTGKSTLPLAELSVGLMLLGAGALIFAREQADTV
jgi:hypothetical protein